MASLNSERLALRAKYYRRQCGRSIEILEEDGQDKQINILIEEEYYKQINK